ncbi:MAG: DUF1415 domain-containing protein, partial [Kangiellaceae bacterium]
MLPDSAAIMLQPEQYINMTKRWLEHSVIEYNFCPFAKKEYVNNSIHYEVIDESNREEQLLSLSEEFKRLDNNPALSTSLLLYPKGLESFFDYLDFVELANELLYELGYEGIYQIASFHPDYCFADTKQSDPENYTNRSPVPIVHLLREDMLEKALDLYPNSEQIPERNILKAQELGSDFFEKLLQ